MDYRKNKLFSPLLGEDYPKPIVVNGIEGDPFMGRSADDKGLNQLIFSAESESVVVYWFSGGW